MAPTRKLPRSRQPASLCLPRLTAPAAPGPAGRGKAASDEQVTAVILNLASENQLFPTSYRNATRKATKPHVHARLCKAGRIPPTPLGSCRSSFLGCPRVSVTRSCPGNAAGSWSSSTSRAHAAWPAPGSVPRRLSQAPLPRAPPRAAAEERPRSGAGGGEARRRVHARHLVYPALAGAAAAGRQVSPHAQKSGPRWVAARWRLRPPFAREPPSSEHPKQSPAPPPN